MLEAYNKHVQERALKNIPPKPLTAEQTQELIMSLLSGTVMIKIPLFNC
jgi:aconitate hydratase 2/2-methylisocitrate dehydratase